VKDGVNWFAYVSNNPLNRIDPTGLREILDDDMHGRPIFTEEEKKKDTRNRIDAYDDRINNAKSIGEAAALEKEQLRKMSEYNNQYFQETTSESWAPGSTLTQGYANKLTDYPINGGVFEMSMLGINVAGTGKTISYTHAGVDRGAGSATDVISPLYSKVLSVEKDQIILNIIGTDHNIKIQHLSPEVLLNYMKGSKFSAGDTIAPFPTESYGDSTSGPHIHFMEGVPFGRDRGHVNPDTHTGVTSKSNFSGEKKQNYEINTFGQSFSYTHTYDSWDVWRAP
jgi:hypothetical protein